MGYELRRMIRDGAPAEWSPLMRLVASEIADDAGDPSAHPLQDAQLPWSAIPVEGEFRHGVWRDGLAERCGMSARAVSRVLTELAATGYEMRQPVTDRDGNPVTDKRGRLVFAVKGHALRFTVPSLPPREQPQRPPDSATNDGESSPYPATNEPRSSPGPATNQADSSPDLAAYDPQRSPNPATPSPQGSSPQEPSPQENQSPHPPALAVVGGVEAQLVADAGEGKTDSESFRRCGYAGCRIRAAVPQGKDMHEGCERFANLKAQAARLELQRPKAS